VIDRRVFLSEMARLGLGATAAPLVWKILSSEAAAAEGGAHPALYWDPAGSSVRCTLCPRRESLKPGELGVCRVRRNRSGRMVTLGYDRPCILNIDPIEKNPLAHVLPGARMLSVAHAGCNIRCLYCQNWQFSQRSPDETKNIKGFRRGEALASARKKELKGIVFTYTEPSTRPEFVGEMAAAAKSVGLAPTLCSCGYVLRKPMRKLLAPFLAVTVTYKGANDAFYRKVCDADLKPVLDTMVLVKSERKWLEVATLVVPTMNDDTASLQTMARWMVRNLGGDTPWHLERFVPQYKLSKLPPTPQATLEKARKIGLDAGLRFVYVSNLAPHAGNHTYCPKCGKAVIKRLGFKILSNGLSRGRCPHCRAALPGLWS
jgi:pyruvate formate lyase activating enzyme